MTGKLLEAYTDGACKRDKRGAAAFFLFHKKRIIANKVKSFSNVTNNLMELIAIEMILDYLISKNFENNTIHIYTDSQLVYNTFTKWIDKWEKQGWKKSNGKPVANKETIKHISLKLKLSLNDIEFHWIRGHTGNKHNDLAHDLCHQTLNV